MLRGHTGQSVADVSFGDVLRRHRVAAGLTQEELAEHAGLSLRGISDLDESVPNWGQGLPVSGRSRVR